MRLFALLHSVAVLLLAVLHAAPATAQGEPRWALVIGNDDYEHVGDLGAAVADSAAMARTLRELDFQVIEARNVTRAGLLRAVRRLQESAAGAVVIVYYAGHGVQIGGRNYLLPVDLEARSEADVEDNAVPIDDILNLLAGARARLTVALLDACRDNPLPPSVRAVGQGMAYDARVPRGQMVVYSAGPGERALDNLGPDDRNPNGLFVRELVPELKRAGVPLDRAVETAAVRISEKAQAIGHDQNPAIYKAYYGEFSLWPGDVSTPAPAREPQGMDVRAWDSAERLDTVASYRAYTDRFCPGGAFCAFADAALQRLQVAPVVPLRPAEPSATVQAAVGVYGDAARRPGEVFRDCAECPEMVVVPAGSFMMGSPASEDGRYDDEGPQHAVTIAQPFAVGRHEITRQEWSQFVTATGYEVEDGCYLWSGNEWKKQAGRNWRDPGFPQTERDPVVCVSWEDARAYIGWLTRETGQPYRLLSEAEWEYAARGGESARRHWGEDNANQEACAYANGADQTAKEQFRDWASILACRDGQVFTAPVGSYRPNGFGLHDMLGNLWEWVEDCYHESYSEAPVDGGDWSEEDCPGRVLRGSSWYGIPRFLRAANRFWIAPNNRNKLSGFRVARLLTP